MADMNIRQMPEELLNGVKAAAAREGLRLREFVIQALTSKIGIDGESSVKTPKKSKVRPSQQVPQVEISDDEDAGNLVEAEEATCKRCDGVVRRDPKNPKYWLCPKEVGRCGRELEDREVC